MNKNNKSTDFLVKFSNRVYPTRICPQGNHEFKPHDARQKFCCPQHRIDYNNDKQKQKNKHDKLMTAAIKSNYGILQKIRSSNLYERYGKIMQDVLDYEGYDFSQYHQKVVNVKNGHDVLMIYNYGLECINMERGEFIIHVSKPKK